MHIVNDRALDVVYIMLEQKKKKQIQTKLSWLEKLPINNNDMREYFDCDVMSQRNSQTPATNY